MDIPFGPLVTAFSALFIVMDPFSSVPVFITLTRSFTPEKKGDAALLAAMVATGVTLGFLFIGPYLLDVMGISIAAFQIAGGVLMFLIAVSFALGIDFGRRQKTPVEAVIIGVPMLAGPGVMLTVMLLSHTIGMESVVVASLGACAASYALLLLSGRLQRLIGPSGLEILSRVMGVLLAAFAMEYILRGLGI